MSKRNTINDLILKTIVDKNTGCWNFTKRKNKKGYGFIRFKNKNTLVHRLSYSYFIGVINSSDVVMHTCDNPSCCNPFHLKKGTHQDNVIDRDNKKRTAIAEKNGKSKLSSTQVMFILKDSREISDIHKDFNFVSKQCIIDIKNKRTWKHLTSKYGIR